MGPKSTNVYAKMYTNVLNVQIWSNMFMRKYWQSRCTQRWLRAASHPHYLRSAVTESLKLLQTCQSVQSGQNGQNSQGLVGEHLQFDSLCHGHCGHHSHRDHRIFQVCGHSPDPVDPDDLDLVAVDQVDPREGNLLPVCHNDRYVPVLGLGILDLAWFALWVGIYRVLVLFLDQSLNLPVYSLNPLPNAER